MLWEAVRVSNARHSSRYSDIGMAILGSADVDGCDGAGAASGARGMAGVASVIPSCACLGEALLAAG